MTITPLSEMDRETIAKHCRKMVSLGIKPDMRLREPLRPGMPMFPRVHAKPLEN